MPTQGTNEVNSPIFRWDTLREIGRHDLAYRVGYPGFRMEIELVNGAIIEVWRASEGNHYFCHGLTFGGKVAPGGPLSPYTGAPVQAILQGFYEAVNESDARPDDILVWRGIEPETTPHSAILTEVVLSQEFNSLHESSRLQSKNGVLPEGNFSLEELWAIYGESYRVFRWRGQRNPERRST